MEMKPQDAQHMAQTVMAGMKIMYDKATNKIFTAGILRKNIAVSQRLATETAGLMKMLMDKSKGTIPKQIIIPSALALMLEMAKFMVDAGIEKPTKQDMDAAKEMLVKILTKMFGDEQAPAAPPQAPPPAAPPGPPQAPPPAPGGLMQQPMGA